MRQTIGSKIFNLVIGFLAISTALFMVYGCTYLNPVSNENLLIVLFCAGFIGLFGLAFLWAELSHYF